MALVRQWARKSPWLINQSVPPLLQVNAVRSTTVSKLKIREEYEENLEGLSFWKQIFHVDWRASEWGPEGRIPAQHKWCHIYPVASWPIPIEKAMRQISGRCIEGYLPASNNPPDWFRSTVKRWEHSKEVRLWLGLDRECRVPQPGKESQVSSLAH